VFIITLRRREFTKEFKLQLLREAEVNGNAASVARKHEINPRLLARWKKQYSNERHPSPPEEGKHSASSEDQESDLILSIRQCETISAVILEYVSRSSHIHPPTVKEILAHLQQMEFGKRSELRESRLDKVISMPRPKPSTERRQMIREMTKEFIDENDAALRRMEDDI
jgi:transposase-like protein